MYITEESLTNSTWQAFERMVSRLLLLEGFASVRMVGQTGDQGADLLASRAGKRWLFQVKHWRRKVPVSVVDETLRALQMYRSQIPVIVSLSGFEESVHQHQHTLMSHGVPLQLWDSKELVKRAQRLLGRPSNFPEPRLYQEEAIRAILHVYQSRSQLSALIVMATGLGKTFVAAEAIRRVNAIRTERVLIVVHSNELVYQAEKAFWPFLTAGQPTVVWNGYEHPAESELNTAPFVFACLDTVSDYVNKGGDLKSFAIVLVDECHHVGAQMYPSLLNKLRAGQEGGPFLLGLTATPWRSDDGKIEDYFGPPLVSVDIVHGMKRGFLANVDYRMYTDNINWEALRQLKGGRYTPRQINRTLFITEWDDAVVLELQRVWQEQVNPRAIVFCGTIDHAITMRDRINALGFCHASAIYSKTASGRTMGGWERNRILSEFEDGAIGAVCAVDILNEGVDVPDVNIIVFQRVTHSRRIFVQQLGRGLRISAGKEKVIVLDFVSDIRRFAAGIDMKDQLLSPDGPSAGNPVRIKIHHKVSFRKAGEEDPHTEAFLRQWLEDVAAVENAGEDTGVLRFPPELPGSHT